jgi:hypothetical protein
MTRRSSAVPDKLHIYARQAFSPRAVIGGAIAGGISMLTVPSHYPRDLKDGAGAFGRWYGADIASSTSRQTGHFLAEVALHEDPRYVPSSCTNPLTRTLHAFAFTFVDKADSGRNTIAVSNFAGAAAGGFVGMGILPDGYNDVTHAGQRAIQNMQFFVIQNIATEYQPELGRILKRIHFPHIPEWWTPEHPAHP